MLDALVYYLNCNAEKIFKSIVSRVFWNQTKLTQANFIAIILLVYCDVESNLDPTVSFESVLTIKKRCSKNIKTFHLNAQVLLGKNLIENSPPGFW